MFVKYRPKEAKNQQSALTKVVQEVNLVYFNHSPKWFGQLWNFQFLLQMLSLDYNSIERRKDRLQKKLFFFGNRKLGVIHQALVADWKLTAKSSPVPGKEKCEGVQEIWRSQGIS